MKADVQYNDLIGTAAADVSDHVRLEDFLEQNDIDTNRFTAIGAEFYSGYSDFFTASIICIDNERSGEDNKYIISINFDLTRDAFFDLFKRFNVIITQRFGNYEKFDISEEVYYKEIN